MNVHNPPYFNKLVIILTAAHKNVFSSKLVAEKKKKSGNALFIKLPRLMDTIQTQFWHLYVVVCHFVKAGILYVLPTYSCDFLSLPRFLRKRLIVSI